MGLLMLNGVAYAGFTEPAEIYSTEEREIGVWTDGKPLYQKTINLGTLTQDSNWHSTPHNISNIERVIEVIGWTSSYNNNSFYLAYSLNSYRPTSSYGIVLQCSSTSVDYLNNWVSGHTAYATIKYTKTTDSAGSGKWSPTGLPAKHYSTDEQVVGTWIDGKPLYEKTFSGTMNYAVSDWTVFGSVADVNKSVHIKSIVEYNNGCLEEPYVSARYYSGNVYYYCSQMGSGSGNGYIVFRYTKTTD